jgi:hypothetical protein
VLLLPEALVQYSRSLASSLTLIFGGRYLIMGCFDQASDFCFHSALIFSILDLQRPHVQVTVSHFVLEISL